MIPTATLPVPFRKASMSAPAWPSTWFRRLRSARNTGAHLERVRNYSRLVTVELAKVDGLSRVIDPHYCELIYLTSPLHDIGKVAIPDTVLLKPGRLSDREFEIMKTHTTIGAETLNAALVEHPGADFMTMARDIAASPDTGRSD